MFDASNMAFILYTYTCMFPMLKTNKNTSRQDGRTRVVNFESRSWQMVQTFFDVYIFF